jgi:hypothetical protein
MKKYSLIILSVFSFSQCASHINNQEERELNMIKIDKPELYIEEKNPTTAWWLGLLPGGGSFYTRQYGYGAINLLTWPLSIFWDPFNGSGGAKDVNYEATMTNVKKKKKDETRILDEKLDAKQISESDYRRKIRAIDEDYSFE